MGDFKQNFTITKNTYEMQTNDPVCFVRNMSHDKLHSVYRKKFWDVFSNSTIGLNCSVINCQRQFKMKHFKMFQDETS